MVVAICCCDMSGARGDCMRRPGVVLVTIASAIIQIPSWVDGTDGESCSTFRESTFIVAGLDIPPRDFETCHGSFFRTRFAFQ
jgi:hypothetical protein